ncbi:MAG: hypothetical protein ACLQVI_02790 [Polyangiaceae bacterium]
MKNAKQATTKKLSLRRITLRLLSVRTGIKAGCHSISQGVVKGGG